MIDDYAPYEPFGGPCVFASEGTIPSRELEPADLIAKRPGVAVFRKWILRSFGGVGIGVGRACPGGVSTSKHHESKAWDWTGPTDGAVDRAIAYLLATDDDGNQHALARRFGIRNIIWQRQIWTAPAGAGWPDFVPYKGDDPHVSHAHFDFSTDGAMGFTSATTGGPVPLGKEAGRSAAPFRGSGGDVDFGDSPEQGEAIAVALYHWTTTADGCVLVDQADGGGLQLPMLGKSAALADAVAAEWGPLAMQHGQMHGVPVSWILAVILRESGGDATARGKDGEIGLMQIIPRSHGMTAAELVAPADNIHKGAQLLGDSRRLGFDLPQALSRYNAGAESSGQPHPSSLSPWGMRETRGHISAVVAAHNYYLGKLCRAGVPAAARLGPLLAFAAVLGWAVVRSP